MAKNDLFSNLTAVADRGNSGSADARRGQDDQFYRPAAPSKSAPAKARSSAPREIDTGRSRRAWAAAGAADVSAAEEEDLDREPFLRSRRRVPVRRGIVPKTRTGRILFATVIVLALAVLTVLALSVRDFLRDDPRFRIDSASSIQIMGNSQLTRAELLSVFGSDIGRNIFFVPLGERRAELERLPWVAHARVMRLLPDQLRVSIVERVPVAFLRDGNSIKLVDAAGVPLEMTPAMMASKRYSFPVVTGIAMTDPPALRAARMRLYEQFMGSLSAAGIKTSSQLSEVDLSDPEDLRAVMAAQNTSLLVHFGEGDFLQRYQRYQQHLSEWQRQYPQLASVDLRYDGQVVLGMAAEESSADAAKARAALRDSAAAPLVEHQAVSAAPEPKKAAARAPAHPPVRPAQHAVAHAGARTRTSKTSPRPSRKTPRKTPAKIAAKHSTKAPVKGSAKSRPAKSAAHPDPMRTVRSQG